MTLPLPDPLVDQREWGEERTGVQRNFETLAQRFPLGPEDLHFGGTVTALPTGVDEGFEVNYIADATNGVVWRFKYLPTTSGTYPWLFIGGPPLYAEVVTTESTTTATYGALATAGPSITLPALAGDFDVEIGARMNNDAANAAAAMSYDIGATGAVDADYITSLQGTGLSANNIYRRRRKTAFAASTALVSKYKRVAGVTAYFEARWMAVTPVRVA